ncbi:hypothetical protein [Laceyella putida]|uniref:DUF4375 domain-containing protein n=1 Tax=Laceyella putida TaxID=110101 RepID=A0ABW2RP13_9BACL
MLVKINRSKFDELDDFSLGSACFDPMIQTYKETRMFGGDVIQFYHDLTVGQQALFMFRIYYDHVHKSLEDLYWWSAYFMAQGRWAALKKGLIHLEDQDALKLFEDIDAFLSKRNHPRGLENFDVSSRDLESDPELFSTFKTFYERYQENTPKTIERIGIYIRSHSSEFIEIIN